MPAVQREAEEDWGSIRVLLEPVAGATGAVARVQPLRHDALEPHLAGVLEHNVKRVHPDAAVTGWGRMKLENYWIEKPRVQSLMSPIPLLAELCFSFT
jgi:hypothetical protein